MCIYKIYFFRIIINYFYYYYVKFRFRDGFYNGNKDFLVNYYL